MPVTRRSTGSSSSSSSSSSVSFLFSKSFFCKDKGPLTSYSLLALWGKELKGPSSLFLLIFYKKSSSSSSSPTKKNKGTTKSVSASGFVLSFFLQRDDDEVKTERESCFFSTKKESVVSVDFLFSTDSILRRVPLQTSLS